MSLGSILSYAGKVLPGATWRALGASPRGPVHLVIAMADHFEPAIDPAGGQKRVPRSEQERRLEWWSREYPEAVDRWRDHDGRPFVHTYFYPAEQYDEALVQMLADHCHAGWGEVEVHLHHGMSQPDTAENTRRVLTEFRDRLVSHHRCLAMEEGSDRPRYAFVHGNFALANSAGGRFCGVGSEMKILAETGCYADFTLPSWPDESQVGHINAIYQCGRPLNERSPHSFGKNLRIGEKPILPILFTGPLVFDWRRRICGLPIPRVDGGVLASNYMPNVERFDRWCGADIGVKGRPEWVFIKLYCHAFFPSDQETLLGEPIRRFL